MTLIKAELAEIKSEYKQKTAEMNEQKLELFVRNNDDEENIKRQFQML